MINIQIPRRWVYLDGEPITGDIMIELSDDSRRKSILHHDGKRIPVWALVSVHNRRGHDTSYLLEVFTDLEHLRDRDKVRIR